MHETAIYTKIAEYLPPMIIIAVSLASAVVFSVIIRSSDDVTRSEAADWSVVCLRFLLFFRIAARKGLLEVRSVLSEVCVDDEVEKGKRGENAFVVIASDITVERCDVNRRNQPGEVGRKTASDDHAGSERSELKSEKVLVESATVDVIVLIDVVVSPSTSSNVCT